MKKNCPDCNQKPGEVHVAGCDVERCALCGGQRISCGCPRVGYTAEQNKYGGRLPWTGEWPGVAECVAFGWYSRWVSIKTGKPIPHEPGKFGEGMWARCKKTDNGAGPNLNRLAEDAQWNKEKRCWEK